MAFVRVTFVRLVAAWLLCGTPRASGQTLVPEWIAAEPSVPFGSIPVSARLLDDRTLLTVLGRSGTLQVIHSDLAGNALGTTLLPSPYSPSMSFPSHAIDGFGAVYTGTTSWSMTGESMHVAKYDGLTGLPLWNAPWRSPGPGSTVLLAIALDAAGDLFVGGFGSSVGLVYKLAGATGSPIWGPREISGPIGSNAILEQIAVDSAGDLLVTGSIYQSGIQRLYFAKVSGSTGALLAGPSTYAGPGADAAWPRAIAPLAGGAVVAGTVSIADPDVLTVRFDASGTVVWSQAMDSGSHTFDYPHAVGVASNGDVFLTGAFADPSVHQTYRLAFSDGSPIWGPVLVSDPDAIYSSPSALAVTREGHVVVRGLTYLAGSADALVYELDGGSGALRWPVTRLTGLGSELLKTVPPLLSPEGDILFVGAGTVNGTDYDAFQARISESTGEMTAGPSALPRALAYADARGAAVDGNGDVIVAIASSSGASPETRFVKYSGSTGQRFWQSSALAATDSWSLRFALDPSGDILFASSIVSGGASIGKVRSSDGAVLWGPMSFSSSGYVSSIAVDSRGYLVVGLPGNSSQEIAWFRGDTGALAFPTVQWTTSYGFVSFRFSLDPFDGVLAVDDNGAARRFTPAGGLAWGPVPAASDRYRSMPACDALGNLFVASVYGPNIVMSKLSGADGSILFSTQIPHTATELSPAFFLVPPSGDVILVTNEYLGPSSESPFPPQASAVRRISGVDGSLLAGPASWVGPDSGFAEPVGAALDASGNPVVCVRAHDGTAYRAAVLGADAALSSLAPIAEYREREDVYLFGFAMRNGHPVIAGRSPERGSSLVVAFGTPLALATQAVQVPAGLCGSPYSFAFAGANGVPPYGFSVASGALPPGLSLHASTGVLSGTPVAAGTYSFRLEVNDSDGRTADADYTMVVAPGPDMAILSVPASVCGTTLSIAGSFASYLWVPTGETTPSITVAPAYAAPYGVIATEADGCIHRGSLLVEADMRPPTVTAPAAIDVDQSLCCGASGGASGGTSAALSAFLTGGSATACSGASTRLSPQVGGADVGNASCFEAGTTSVTFRFRGSTGAVGSATSNVTVRMFGDLDVDRSVDATDMVVLRAYLNSVVAPGTPPFAASLGMADLTHDGAVDAGDMIILRAYINSSVACLAP